MNKLTAITSKQLLQCIHIIVNYIEINICKYEIINNNTANITTFVTFLKST